MPSSHSIVQNGANFCTVARLLVCCVAVLCVCVRGLFVVRFKFPVRLVYVLFRLVWFGWLERGKSVDSIEHIKKH